MTFENNAFYVRRSELTQPIQALIRDNAVWEYNWIASSPTDLRSPQCVLRNEMKKRHHMVISITRIISFFRQFGFREIRAIHTEEENINYIS